MDLQWLDFNHLIRRFEFRFWGIDNLTFQFISALYLFDFGTYWVLIAFYYALLVATALSCLEPKLLTLNFALISLRTWCCIMRSTLCSSHSAQKGPQDLQERERLLSLKIFVVQLILAQTAWLARIFGRQSLMSRPAINAGHSFNCSAWRWSKSPNWNLPNWQRQAGFGPNSAKLTPFRAASFKR